MSNHTPYRRFVLALIALCALAGSQFGASAQDGGDSDRDALVGRVLDAVRASEDFTSFVSTAHETSDETRAITIGSNELQTASHHVIEKTTTFTHDAAGQPNFQNVYRADMRETDSRVDGAQTDSLTAEARVVDGLVYLSAARAGDGADSPLPEGWVILTDAAEWPALDVLALDDLLNNLDSPDLYDENVSLLLAHTSEASLASGTLDDGTPVDVITLRLAGDDLVAGVLAFSSAARAGDALIQAFYSALDADSAWEMAFQIDADGNIRAFDSAMRLGWTDFDLSAFSEQTPPNTLLTQTNETTGTYTIRDIDAPIEPFAAPAVD